MKTEEMFAAELLGEVYPKRYVFFSSIDLFDPENLSLMARFSVPADDGHLKTFYNWNRYTLDYLGYVPAEQLMRCVNQLGFVLTGLLIRRRKRIFRGAKLGYFRKNLLKFVIAEYSVRHRKKLPKGHDFLIHGAIRRVRITTSGLSVIHMTFDGAIEGEAAFAWQAHP